MAETKCRNLGVIYGRVVVAIYQPTGVVVPGDERPVFVIGVVEVGFCTQIRFGRIWKWQTYHVMFNGIASLRQLYKLHLARVFLRVPKELLWLLRRNRGSDHHGRVLSRVDLPSVTTAELCLHPNRH